MPLLLDNQVPPLAGKMCAVSPMHKEAGDMPDIMGKSLTVIELLLDSKHREVAL